MTEEEILKFRKLQELYDRQYRKITTFFKIVQPSIDHNNLSESERGFIDFNKKQIESLYEELEQCFHSLE